MGNKNLSRAKNAKNDEFYTRLEYTGGSDDDIMVGVKTDLKGDGDFRSDECIEILKEADIVVTNPPFSEVRTYIAQLMEYNKKFLIICNQNALTYKEVFPLFKDNKIWIGYNKPKEFYVPENTKERKNIVRNAEGKLVAKFGNILWFTNLDIDKRHHLLDLVFFYEDNPEKYPKYDNYDAIEVSKVADIPADYEGVMGVPITFLDKYSPEQFEILDANNYRKDNFTKIKAHGLIKDADGSVNGRNKYARILIKNKNPKSKKEVLGL